MSYRTRVQRYHSEQNYIARRRRGMRRFAGALLALAAALCTLAVFA